MCRDRPALEWGRFVRSASSAAALLGSTSAWSPDPRLKEPVQKSRKGHFGPTTRRWRHLLGVERTMGGRLVPRTSRVNACFRAAPHKRSTVILSSYDPDERRGARLPNDRMAECVRFKCSDFIFAQNIHESDLFYVTSAFPFPFLFRILSYKKTCHL